MKAGRPPHDERNENVAFQLLNGDKNNDGVNAERERFGKAARNATEPAKIGPTTGTISKTPAKIPSTSAYLTPRNHKLTATSEPTKKPRKSWARNQLPILRRERATTLKT